MCESLFYIKLYRLLLEQGGGAKNEYNAPHPPVTLTLSILFKFSVEYELYYEINGVVQIMFLIPPTFSLNSVNIAESLISWNDGMQHLIYNGNFS